MIELLAATSCASIPRMDSVIQKFSQQGRLTWLKANESSLQTVMPKAPMVSKIGDLQVGNRVIVLVMPPEDEVADIGEYENVLWVTERLSASSSNRKKPVIIDSFSQLESLSTLPDYPGIHRLLQCSNWTAEDFRSAILNRYSEALDALRDHRRAAVFGAQRLGEEVSGSLISSGITPEVFIDNNASKHGANINGIPILPLSALPDNNLPIVIATTRFTSSITRQLKAGGFRHILPYSVMSLVDGERYPEEIPYVGIQQDFADHRAKYLSLFLTLSDEKSRRVLDGLVSYRLDYDSSLADAVADEYTRQYFDEELIEFNGADVFVDLGGYDGDTAENFIKYSGGAAYKKIYVFEPDENLVRRATERLQGCKAIEFIPAGAYSSDGELRFAASGRTNGAISESGELVIPVRRIDSVVVEAPTLIKMDIEGAETEALRGADSLLRATPRPKLAIAAYHYAPDLWKLVDVVREINPDYRFYLRHYSETGLESVIYAI